MQSIFIDLNQNTRLYLSMLKVIIKLFFYIIISFLFSGCQNSETSSSNKGWRTVTFPINPSKLYFLVITNPTDQWPDEKVISFSKESSRMVVNNLSVDYDTLRVSAGEKKTFHEHHNLPLGLIEDTYGGARGVADGLSKADVPYVVNNTQEEFYMYYLKTQKEATVRYVKEVGDWCVIIWVTDDAWNKSGKNDPDVNGATIEELADNFLSEGSNNDIFDKVTATFGEPWGTYPAEFNNRLIPPTERRIHILLTDINGDKAAKNGESRIRGYFTSANNYTFGLSSQKLLFVMDAYYFNRDGSQQVLAHELQHMIHFYQKYVLKNARSATWFNEMLSTMAEDVVINELNMDAEMFTGSIAEYLQNPHESMTEWENTVTDYHSVRAFGAYMLRRYGKEYATKVMQSKFPNKAAIEDTAGIPWNVLLEDWGRAFLKGFPNENNSTLADIDLWKLNLWTPTFSFFPVSGIPMYSIDGESIFVQKFKKPSIVSYPSVIPAPEPGGNQFIYIGYTYNDTSDEAEYSVYINDDSTMRISVVELDQNP